ncbi:hypothetical protein FGG08_000531 [Glutinoglossum americanum]|uniref:Uncharacterized protein n=1 Tax=Glutinoglossum americanum TaxID=1670608 RepID=A0A9P8ID11_9PEZI|nr:hypothetical protein FGG08_000531 [Glutinoglossum americanum]
MKLAGVFTALTLASAASAWTLTIHYVNGQHLDMHGTSSSGCVDLRTIDSMAMDYYFNPKTDWWPDPNRVRLYGNTGCDNQVWDSNREGSSDLVPDRYVRSYIVDHD